MKKKILVTGSAGFIGFHLSRSLLKKGLTIIGVDAITDYYDIQLKNNRLKILKKFENFFEENLNLIDQDALFRIFEKYKPTIVIHLAAQAGVRYSIDNPRSYLESNIIGTFNILEAVKNGDINHTLIASTSSAYGANKEMPFDENQKADYQMSFYAASKKTCEVISHSYSHIHNLPITNFRFFTVYGPWGRPDMALFKFVKAMHEQKPINIYNNGEMKRDFTYIDDLVKGINLLIDCIPQKGKRISENDSLSPVAPWRVVNIGNSKVQNLMDFIREIERNLNCNSKKNYLPMQKGDVKETWANCDLLKDLTGFIPETNIEKGIKNFCDWYKDYYL